MHITVVKPRKNGLLRAVPGPRSCKNKLKATLKQMHHDVRLQDHFAVADFDMFSDFINVLKRNACFSTSYQSTRAVTYSNYSNMLY
jgi:hypothetical protein